ncbi:MAG: ATP-binding protein [Planctomycetota bacterium]
MNQNPVDLQRDDFAIAMPFGFIVDQQGKLTTVGTALRRCLGIAPGDSIDDQFTIVRPMGREQYGSLACNPSTTVHLRANYGDIELKGSKVTTGGGSHSAFFGSPIVGDIDEFKKLGLRISDFPPADATPDLLLSMQATRTALHDTRKLSEELQTALGNAHAATEAKARFLAVISHEIRTPLNGFGSMIDLLRDGDLNGEQCEQLDTMDICAQSLLALVNDILDFSKLEVDKIIIERKPMLLSAALAQIIAHFRALASDRGIPLQLEQDFDDLEWVLLDFERVRQILSNLIGNAIKFTSEGRIRIVAKKTGDLLSVDVIDSGLGIPKESRAHLFEPFVQADSSTTRKFGGTGLGLTISRQLARAMAGNVEMVRSDESGTQFRLTLSALTCDGVTAEPPRPTEHEEDSFPGVSVLVAEDDPTNQVIARRMLEKIGVRVSVACDGIEAKELAKRERFDLILMDLMMPHMDGIEATRRIRSDPGPCRNTPIVAFSAAALEADREAAKRAGTTGFLEKPARLAAVRGVLRRYLPRISAE